MSADKSQKSDATFDISDVRGGPQTLEFSYSVVNGDDTPLFLDNRLFRRTPSGFVLDPDVVDAERDESGLVRLSKRLAAIPETLDVEAPEIPYLSRVEAGASFTEQVSVALPIAPHAPYRRGQGLSEEDAVDDFVFTIGYFPADGRAAPALVRVARGGKEWFLDYGSLVQVQQLWTSAPVTAAVTTTIPR